jgi:DNA polymerase/3'-5' exonuclease PolX
MDIRELAAVLVENLRAGCEKIQIAGSIRRGKAEPRDIELVAVPLVETVCDTVDLFGAPYGTRNISRLDECLEALFLTPALGWRLDATLPRNGSKYKRLFHGPTQIACDLFIVTAETWGNQLTIRTGPGDFSQALVTRALALGLKQDGGHLWKLHRDDTRTVIPCPEELDFFAALKVPYLEPHERSVDALRKVLA